ncbi:MAG: ketopantoate reductase family protein [Gemmatimonadota bacterium]|nr:ketopantoate reductase family protein [Gemmatimonadota bacterium]
MSDSQPLRVVALGAGAVGGYFGGALAHAGHKVTMLARGENLAAIRARGLELRVSASAMNAQSGAPPLAQSILAPVNATDDLDALPEADLVLVTVKSYSLHEVARAAVRLAEGGAMVVPLLNGIDAADRLAALGVPRSALLGGVTVISVAKIGPGIIERRSAFQRVVIGQLDGSAGSGSDANESGVVERINRIVAAFQDAGVEARVSPQIDVELWHKLIFLASMAAACGLARRDVGAVRAAPLGHILIGRAVAEIVAVARAHGVGVDANIAEQTIATIEALPAAMRPSFLADVERGGPTELDVLSGAVSRLGRKYGIPTPVHDTAVAALGAATGMTES